jgi:clan AA aspartic protease
MFKKWHVKRIQNEEYIFTDCKVANPLDSKKTIKVEFLVDTGASGCAISQDVAEALDLEPCGIIDAGLADGSVKRVKAAYITLEIGGRKLYTWTIYDKGFTPILGLDVMRVLGIHVDVPQKKILMPYKGLKFKRVRLMTNMPSLNFMFTYAMKYKYRGVGVENLEKH